MSNVKNTGTEAAAKLLDATTAEVTAPEPPAALPDDYLANGYYATATNGKPYLRPELVGDHAQAIARTLSDMKPTDFNGLMRTLKAAKSNSLPYEAKQTAMQELLPKAMMLVSKKKAPALLVDFVRTNIDHIHDANDWMGFYRHMEAIAGFLTMKEET